MFQYHEKWKNPKTGRYSKHVYTYDDKPMKGITSVLNVISKPALYQWYANKVVEYIKNLVSFQTEGKIAEEELEKARTAANDNKENAADIGTVAHKMVELYVNQQIAQEFSTIHIDEAIRLIREEDHKKIPDLTPEEVDKVLLMYTNFVNWATQENIEFLASEQKIYSVEHWIAGTVDLVIKWNGKKLIGDVKTYSGIYDRTPFFQCAGYRIMITEGKEDDFDGSVIIRLGKDGSFETKTSFDFDTDKRGFLAALELQNMLDTYKR